MSTAVVVSATVQGRSYNVVIEDGPVIVTVALSEQDALPRTWSPQSVTVANRAEGASLTGGGLRSSAWSLWLRLAKEAATDASSRGFSLTQPSDPPATFLEDRRGKASRDARDYAELADVVLQAPVGLSARSLARAWAGRHGGTAATWQNRISQALRDHVGPGGELTAEATRLLGREGLSSQLAVEDKVEGARRYLGDRDTSRPRSDDIRRRVTREDRLLEREEGSAAPRKRHAQARELEESFYGAESAQTLFDEVEAAPDVEALRTLWATYREHLEADEDLLKRWKARGREIEASKAD